MSNTRPPTILCLASYEKGAEFLRESKRLGARVLFLTVDSLRDAPWPYESVDERYFMPDLYNRANVLRGVSYLARSERIDRIIPLDEFDLEMAAHLREHLRLPGLGETQARFFRDKLAMRLRAQEAGIPVPPFVGVINYDALRDYMERVPPPWVLKPRTQASALGIKKIHEPEALWRTLDTLGEGSFHLLEAFVPGDVYHVDSVVWEGEVVFAEVHRYANPPFDVMHGSGIFCTRTLERGSKDERALKETVKTMVGAFGMVRGVLHTEFIKGEDGHFFFLETAARVGGANIAETVEAATGINLWREWARLEVSHIRGEVYSLPEPRRDYAGVLISLAKQEWPDLSAYKDSDIVWRMSKRHHAGLIVASSEAERVQGLLEGYMTRFYEDFHASMPAPESATE